MLNANELKVGTLYIVNGAPHIVETLFKQSPSARGAVTLYKIRARNLLTKVKIDQSYRGEDVFAEPNFSRQPLQYLYKDDQFCSFMDTNSYEQYNVAVKDLEDEIPFLVENLEGISGLVLDERLVGVQLPDVVEMKLVECDPSMKGASATARTKPAVTETGLTVQVPEYMAPGEIVRVDTRNSKFLGRA
jgi:elongation factor P